MCLLAETLSPSTAIICLAYLLEEHTHSLLCSSPAAWKAQPGEPLPPSLPLFLSSLVSPSELVFPCHFLHISKSPAPTMFSVCLLWLLPWAQQRRREVNLRSGPWWVYSFSARGKWFPTSPVCLRKWAFLTTATFQGWCLCTFQLDHPSWLLCPVDLPKGCRLEPLSRTNPVKLTVPFGSSEDCSPKENITNKSPSKIGGMWFCIFSCYFLPPTQGKYWINSVYWGAGEKIQEVLI